MSVAAPLDMAVEEVFDAADFAAATGANPTQIADLETFRELLVEWNAKMNLVGASTLDQFWSRHAWDSAQLLTLAPGVRTWADLGTGAGLPGIVLAVFGKSQEGFHVHLVESMLKRCRFLSEVVEVLGLPATVHNARAEDVDLRVEAVTARAMAPLWRLLGYSQGYFRGGATGWFLKGQDVASEVKEATRYWDFEADILPSRSDERGRIVHVRRLGRGRKT